MSFKEKTALFCILCFLCISLQGCEKITELVEKYKPQKKTPKEVSLNTDMRSPRISDPITQEPITTSPPAEKQPILAPNTLATVGSWSITKEEFQERLQALKELVPDYDIEDIEQNKLVLEELINQQLIVQEAEKTGVAQNKDIMDAVEEFRRTLIVREMADQLVKDANATDEEVREYYDNNKTEFVEPVQWRIREIVVKDEETAKNILIELYQGADFQEMVKARSTAKSAWKKGDLDFRVAFDFPKMQSIVAALEVGDISSVFKGPEGFYIVKLEEKKGGKQQTFDQVQVQIAEGLTIFKQRQKISETLQELRNKTVVNINEKLLEE